MNKGIIYLLQPSELIGTISFRNSRTTGGCCTFISKIGCYTNNDLVRCEAGYKKGSRY